MMMPRKLLMAIALIATGIYGSAASADDAVSFRLNWYLSGWMAPFFYAHQQGYYKDVGIDLTIHEGRGSGVAVKVVGAKDDTFAFADVSTMMLAVAKGVDIRSISTILTINDASVIFLSETNIKTAEDLKGKSIAMTSGDASTASFPAILKANKISRDEVNVILVDPAAKPVMVMEKKADALLGGMSDQPFLIRSKGFDVKSLTFSDLGVTLLGFSLLAHNDLIKENPDLVRRFVEATNRGWEEARKDPKKVMPALTKVKSDFDIERGLGQLEVMLALMDSPRTAGKSVGYHAAEDWQEMLDILKQYREMKTDLPADAFYTNQFIKQN